MPNLYDQEPISVVEDLDPEPPGSERRRRLGELVLGLALLLGVLTWGGWQWWRDTTLQSAYREGSAAAERREWDAARDAFHLASGYRDADTRAADATRMASLRDRLYATAAEAMGRDRPLEALRATTQLSTIQPDYRDSRSMHERALTGATNNALAGVGVSGLTAVTGLRPGIYVGLEGGRVRLDGSDIGSLILAGSLDEPGSCAVYDAPNPSGRSLRLACVEGGTVRTRPLDSAVPPERFDRYVAGTHGAWGLDVVPTETPTASDFKSEDMRWRSRLQGALLDYGITYLPAGDRAIEYKQSDSRWVPMALGDEGGMLLAVPVWHGPGDPSGPGMGLYIERPDGSPPRLLHEQEGGFISAYLGPGERFALLTSYMPLPGSGEEHRLLLIDTRTGAASVLVSQATYVDAAPSVQLVGGAFIRGGVLDGKVVAARWAYEGQLALYDPERPDEPLAGLPVSGYPASRVYASGSTQGPAIVGWQTASGSGRGPSTATIAILRPGRESWAFDGPLPEGETMWGVAMRGDNAFYITRRTGYPVNRRGPIRVRGMYAPERIIAGRISVLYSEPSYDWSQMPARAVRPALSWHLGNEGVAYVEDGLLQVAPYDGTPPVVLAPGMEPLPFSGERRSEWVR